MDEDEARFGLGVSLVDDVDAVAARRDVALPRTSAGTQASFPPVTAMYSPVT